MNCTAKDGWGDPIAVLFGDEEFFFSTDTSQNQGRDWQLEFWYHMTHEQIRDLMASRELTEILNPCTEYRIAARFMHGSGEQFREHHPERDGCWT